MKSTSVLVTIVSAATLAGGTASASAATIAFEEAVSPTPQYTHHAAYVRNDGGNSGMVSNQTRLLAGSVNGGVLRSIFSFDLSAIPDGATVTGVTFDIYQEADTGDSVNQDYTVDLRTISAPFNESSANWNNTFGGTTTLGPTLSSTIMNPETVETGTLHTFQSTESFATAVQAAVNSPDNLFNFALLVPAAEGTSDRVIMRLGADETNTAPPMVGLRPRLTIEYAAIPEPASLSLLGLGALALRRRRA